MKKIVIAGCAAALGLGTAGAWKPAEGMKTIWGEKVTPENAWREYPRPQMVRDNWTNLNGLWQYAVTENAPGIPTKWDGEILVPFVIESSLSGVKRELKPSETLWYRRTFTARVKPGERLLLHVEQADFRAQVYVNGVEAGLPHEGGQTPFSHDITDLVKAGENELVVSVWDPTTDFIGSHGKQLFKPQGCFYTRSSGIGGTVWLETVPETHLTDYKVVTDIDAGTVAVTLDGTGNLTAARGTVEVFRDGKKLASGEMTAWGKPVTLKLPAPVALWSPESPALYDLEITFADGGAKTKDVVKGYFGMRKIEVKKDANGVLKFFFNNKPRFLIGTLDQGWWPDGLLTPPSDEAMAFDIRALKKMGYGDTGKDANRQAVERKVVALMRHVGDKLVPEGLAGCIYTQTTDIEAEINGLMTYDRKVVKFDADALAAAHAKVREKFAQSLDPIRRVVPRLAE